MAIQHVGMHAQVCNHPFFILSVYMSLFWYAFSFSGKKLSTLIMWKHKLDAHPKSASLLTMESWSWYTKLQVVIAYCKILREPVTSVWCYFTNFSLGIVWAGLNWAGIGGSGSKFILYYYLSINLSYWAVWVHSQVFKFSGSVYQWLYR